MQNCKITHCEKGKIKKKDKNVATIQPRQCSDAAVMHQVVDCVKPQLGEQRGRAASVAATVVVKRDGCFSLENKHNECCHSRHE